VSVKPCSSELDVDPDPSDDTELAAEMEWDPQTDVASPMLPIQGVSRQKGPKTWVL